MYLEKNEKRIIYLADEMNIFGISAEADKIDFGVMWDKMGDIESAAKQKSADSAYGLWINPHPNGRYFIGVQVAEREGQDEEYDTFTVPEGKYLEICFNGENVGEVLGEKLAFKWKEAESWAAGNRMKINWDVAIEIYPKGFFEMKYPQMCYLCHLEDNRADAI